MVILFAWFTSVLALIVCFLFWNKEKRRNRQENYLSGCSLQLASDTKISHATEVITLLSKQPICFYSGARSSFHAWQSDSNPLDRYRSSSRLTKTTTTTTGVLPRFARNFVSSKHAYTGGWGRESLRGAPAPPNPSIKPPLQLREWKGKSTGTTHRMYCFRVFTRYCTSAEQKYDRGGAGVRLSAREAWKNFFTNFFLRQGALS